MPCVKHYFTEWRLYKPHNNDILVVIPANYLPVDTWL